ncbi:hypothetical protein D3C72_1253070 [compost metagenome]
MGKSGPLFDGGHRLFFGNDGLPSLPAYSRHRCFSHRAGRHAFSGNLSGGRLLRAAAFRRGVARFLDSFCRQADDDPHALYARGCCGGAPADLWPFSRQHIDRHHGPDHPLSSDGGDRARAVCQYRLSGRDGCADGLGHQSALHRRHRHHPVL